MSTTQSIEFHGWQFRIDASGTLAAYSQWKGRRAEDCSCAYCRNWIAQRDAECPAELRRFLEIVGVDPHKEAEVWQAGPLDGGYAFNSGWWHFIGQVEKKGPDTIQLEPQQLGKGKDWSLSFFPEKVDLKISTLPNSPIIQIEFAVSLPWVLAEKYPQ